MQVLKRDGSFKICGYFKVTLNPPLEIDQHAIPKAGDSFANLAKVNSTPYSICIKHTNNCCCMKNQPSWSWWTRILGCTATIIYRFQRTMDQLQNGLIGVRCYLNDIIFTGNSRKEHFNKLYQVLELLQDKGFDLKNDKCHFLQSRHVIDANEVHNTPTQTISHCGSFSDLII